ncbi:uncharacterized protein [Eurosta solidaginis]|uniref:uncharacterized protein isoform X2 n=1 Tax=Eurosta solidaginis TaxID=178769 RepID=UPI0035312BF7
MRVSARFCEGGHYCSLPRECCTQGCCPPYQSGPRQLPPPSEHVLNLFFISHWFFWCVIAAIILAILCAYSLWKRRRTLCGWGFNGQHAQSERDSAGSCYAPPHYSRCNSFHHPPPPYTEVTSKPDLYPLVFTCNSDNSKTGSSYLMVQYFRNYIVRPVASLSAASTVDSLSSSFICNINEANTLIPPPYSRAASPEIGFNSHFQQQFMIPRSASQLGYASGANGVINNTGAHDINGGIAQPVYQSQQSRCPHFTVVALNGSRCGNESGIDTENTINSSISYSRILQAPVAENLSFKDDSVTSSHNCTNNQKENRYSSGSYSGSNRSSECGSIASAGGIPKDFIKSQSDEQIRYVNNSNSNSNISDNFINNRVVVAYTSTTNGTGIETLDIVNFDKTRNVTPTEVPDEITKQAIYNNDSIISKPLHRTNTNPTQFVVASNILRPTYTSCDSVGSISFTVPRGVEEFKDFHILKQSLETCCHILQQQQNPNSTTYAKECPPLGINELDKKYTSDELRDYTVSVNCSAISSLTNVCTASSPPQATSPTGGVREILEQIRQLQDGISNEDMLMHVRPTLCHTLSSPTSLELNKSISTNPQRKTHRNSLACCEMPCNHNVLAERSPQFSKTTVRLASTSPHKGISTVITTTTQNTLASSNDTDNFFTRPLTLEQNKNKFFTPKPNKCLYIPMISNITTTPVNKYSARSPINSAVGTNLFSGKGGRVRRIWVSRSAPTTPGSSLPPNRFSDNSPLLTEHDEDQETEPNENIE